MLGAILWRKIKSDLQFTLQLILNYDKPLQEELSITADEISAGRRE